MFTFININKYQNNKIKFETLGCSVMPKLEIE